VIDESSSHVVDATWEAAEEQTVPG
jgi:hypothetical protein